LKISFPHMGTSPIAFKMLVRDLGHEVVVPPRPSTRTLSLGTEYAPEFACLPLKILLGTYLEVLEQGADTIVTTGGVGPCRAGLYAELQKKILEDLGYEFKMVVLEPPRWGYLDFLRKLRFLKGDRSWSELWRVIKKAWSKVKALDDTEKALHWVRPRELEQGSSTRTYQRALKLLDDACTEEEIKQARLEALRMMKSVPMDPDREVLKVGIVGEIYVVLEPASNLDLERMLGEMGVEVNRSIFLTGWTRDNAVLDSARVKHGVTVKKAAAPYMPEMIGGHGQDSVGHTILYAQDGFDGVVQLAPFTCIPEIVARSLMPQVSRDYDIPVLTFFLDEQTGEAGVRTRLEAFVDLLWRRRRKRAGAGLYKPVASPAAR